MVLEDPILNFLWMLVGIATGWLIYHAGEVSRRHETWGPVVFLLWVVAAGVTMWLLAVGLGLRNHLPLVPLLMGNVIGMLIHRRASRR